MLACVRIIWRAYQNDCCAPEFLFSVGLRQDPGICILDTFVSGATTYLGTALQFLITLNIEANTLLF
jgi:hypothetical protein